MTRLVFLATDYFLFSLVVIMAGLLYLLRNRAELKDIRKGLFTSIWSIAAIGVFAVYFSVAMLDSIRFQPARVTETGEVLKDAEGDIVYAEARTVFDVLIATLYKGVRVEDHRIIANFERSYSRPGADAELTPKITTDPDSGEMVLSEVPLKEPGAHFLGTDESGNDVFYLTLKGVRTAFIVGLVTTLIAVPFAMLFGICAGYFGGFIDDLIQFIYTSLSSIPSILLIISLVMIIDVKINTATVDDLLMKDDLRVLGICCILGLLGWTSLCRLLRAETLKIRELDFVQAARTLGSSHAKIIFKHIVPNVMHIVLITFILAFSGLVMVEVILQYIKIGVPNSFASWGRIIDGARGELARDPIVSWPLMSAFWAMFFLVLTMNYIGDVIRDALDPRLRR
jgi:peptide/nickel transport system permease protein